MNLNTRQFGRVVEVLIKLIYNQQESGDLSYDLLQGEYKIEVKGSRVFKKNYLEINECNQYDVIVSNSNRNRLIASGDIHKFDFDCNIQQIKIDYFDFMFYVLFFSDVVEIFKLTPSVLKEDTKIQYSDKQHRGNKGEGQFHINNVTYSHHKENYFEISFSYAELKDILLANNK